MKKLLAVMGGVAIALLAATGYAAPITGPSVPELSGLDTVMTNWTGKYGFQAATLAVVKDNRLVYERGYGYQDKNLTQPILHNARMRLATNSVHLTKRALRQLIADGQLNGSSLVYQVVNLQPWSGSYADSRMQQITIQHLLDETSCLLDHAPSVKDIGQAMGLNRNATLAESIRYLWSQSSTMVPSCTVGTTYSGSHYAMEMAGQIIAKKSNPSLNDADPTAAGVAYGNYIKNNLGQPISADFWQANNLESEAQQNEIWYKSLFNCDPEWNRNWAPNQPQVSCAYAIDFYARPGSGTIISAARDFARYLKTYWHNGVPKPANLSGYSSYVVSYGSLPGTSTITVDQVWSSGTSRSFIVLVNQHNETITPDTSFDEIVSGIENYLNGVTTWPSIDLFFTCQEFTATNANHVTAGRAYTKTTGTWYKTTTWYANGSNNNLGTSGSTSTKLAETSSGYFIKGSCPVAPTVNSINATVNGSSVTISGTAADANSNLSKVEVEFDGNGTWLTASGTTSWSLTKSDLPIGSHTARARAVDTTNLISAPTQPVSFTTVNAPACVTAKNLTHISAGRAHTCTVYYTTHACANGSNQDLGAASTYNNPTTSIKETSPNYWVKVASCS